ncbi:MAG: hypothetical protein JWO69_1482 [Thermoleophilia bacterium]|jgi:hypothetical protein|nr:hypothetical protein [Thermoleophilia bacterium]
MNLRLVIPAFASAALLFGSLADHGSYDYYMVMRWAVTASAAWIAFAAYRLQREPLMWMFIAAAILFNPVAMITMTKEQWAPVDVVAALVFAAAPFVIRARKSDP